jgi:DNA polymerase-4
MNKPGRSVAHFDLDSFFVSVEVLKQPKLKGLPVIIGGSGDRGVVASCSYEARAFGVHAAMPGKMAKKLCPHAIWIRGDMEDYSKHSKIIREILLEKAPILEQASIDEFYMDLSGMDTFFNSLKWTSELRQKVMKESGLPVSFGLSVNKVVSKVATGEAKPNGQLHIPFGEEKRFLEPLPVRKLPMVGPKSAAQLEQVGVLDIRTLAAMPMDILESMFGKMGLLIWQRANGIDYSAVEPYSERKSMSSERTFQEDTIDVKFLRHKIRSMVEGLAFELRKEGFLCGCVTVKLRYSNFDTETKQVHLPYTSADHVLMEVAESLLQKVYQRRMLVRLIGVRLSDLVHGTYQVGLFEDPKRTVQLYQAMDKIRMKYGKDSVGRGG